MRLAELDIGESPGLLLEFRIRLSGVRLRRSSSERPPLVFFVRVLLSALPPVGKTIPSSDSDVVESDVESDGPGWEEILDDKLS